MWSEKENKQTKNHQDPSHVTKENYLEVEHTLPVLLSEFDVKQAAEIFPHS